MRQNKIEMKRVPSYHSKGGMYRRRCTMDWKIRPIHRYVRTRLGLSKGQLMRRYARCLLGISVDEAHRMAPSRKYWELKTYPLVEANMSRVECRKLLDEMGFGEVPSSACVFCPFQSSGRWRQIRQNPRDYQHALDAETQIDGTFHRSGLPLQDAIAQMDEQGELFAEECSGICGV